MLLVITQAVGRVTSTKSPPPPPNDRVQQRGRLGRLQTLESRHAGPVCCNALFGLETLNAPDAVNRYLSFFSLSALISYSCFWPPNSAAPFPLSLSPSTVSLYSTVISLSMSFRTAENVSVPSFSFRSLRLASFW